MNNKNSALEKKRKYKIWMILAILGIVYYSTRLFMVGVPHYHLEDTYFHLNRLIGLENVWISPINFHSFEGIGTKVNVFYPWLTMYPMHILFVVCGRYIMAYKLYYLLLSVTTIFLAYISMLKMSRSQFSAFLFAIIYTYSSYRFTDVFRRQALGECIVITILPLVLLGVYYIDFNNYKNWQILSVSMTLIAYSHLISLLYTSIMVVVIFVLSITHMGNIRERVFSMIKAAVFSLLMSMGMLVQIITKYRDDFYRPRGSGTLAEETAYSIRTIFSNSIKNSTTADSVGLLVLFSLIIGSYIIATTIIFEKDKTNLKLMGVLMLSGFLFLIGASSVFPWYYLGEHTILGNIQFVWRLNAYSTLLIMAAFALAMKQYEDSKRMSRTILFLIITLSLCLHFSSITKLHKEERERILEKDVMTSLVEKRGPYYDYSPNQSRLYYEENGYTLNKYYLDEKEVSPNVIIDNCGTNMRILLTKENNSGIIDIPIIFYDDVIITVNDNKPNIAMSERGTLSVELPKDKEIEIEIKYSYDSFAIAGCIISLLACLTLAIIVIQRRKII